MNIDKPRILLINPSFSGMKFARAGRDSAPLGILSIGSYLKKHGFDVTLIDCLVSDFDFNTVKDFDFVGFTVMSVQIPEAYKLSKNIKEKYPEVRIIWGCVVPTLYPKVCSKSEYVDHVVVGYGEVAMLEIVTGVIRKGQKIVFGKMPEEIPPLDYSLLGKRVSDIVELAPTLTSRGCCYRCAFCINPITKTKWTSMSVETAVEEIKKAKKAFPGRPIRIWDENFFVNQQRAKDIVKEFIKLKIKWETTIRCDSWAFKNAKFMKLLKKSGCYLLSMGAESGSQKVLDYLKKDIKVEDIVRSNVECKKVGIKAQYSFMIGVPHETKKDMLKTINLIKKLKADNPNCQVLGLQPYRNYPGSPIYEELKEVWHEPTDLEGWVEYMERTWNFIEPKDCPWLEKQNLDLVENAWAYCSYAYADKKKIMKGSGGVQANFPLRLAFALMAKLRWHLNFFDFPFEMKLAKLILPQAKPEQKA